MHLLTTIDGTLYLKGGEKISCQGYSIYIIGTTRHALPHVNHVTFKWGKWAIYWKVFSAKYTPSSKTNPSKVNGKLKVTKYSIG